MDFSRLDRNRVLLGGIGSIVLIISILFLPWYSLGHTVSRDPSSQSYDPSTFICGTGNYSCTGFQTFPIAALATARWRPRPLDPRLDSRPRAQALVGAR